MLEQEIVINPSAYAPGFKLKEVLKYRHLLWSMVWRDMRLQFDDMYLGFLWGMMRPLAMLGVFTFIKHFSRANLYEAVPYSLYFYSGIILWHYFLQAAKTSQRSVMKDVGLMKQVYYPRIITPLVGIFSSFYNFGIALIPLIVMILWQKVYPDWRIVLLFPVLLQTMCLALAVGMTFASLCILSRDYERILELILYLGLFISPVIYSPDMIPARGQLFYFINPLAGTLLAFRACFFHGFPFPVWQFAYSCIFSSILLVVAAAMFRKAEVYFTDRV